MDEILAWLKIALGCTLAACLYGIVHDQITARICVEYFTIGHPPVFDTDDPTRLGFGWGILATWWVGVSVGVVLAAAARLGKRPRREPETLVRPVAILLGAMAICAVVFGGIGWLLARSGAVYLDYPLPGLAPEREVPFLVDLWAHSASYISGASGSVIVAALVWRARQ